MPTQVIMPQLGESVIEGTITRWLKSVGDPVEEYEPLVEINTDKVDTEVPSPASGVILEILVPEGVTVQAGAPLAVIGQAGEVVSAPQISGERAQPAQPAEAPAATTAAPSPRRDLGFISPVVAKIASEHQIDLSQVVGTGQGGRITKKDVLNYLEQRSKESPVLAPVAAPQVSSTAPAVAPPAVMPGEEEILPLTAVRRSIAEHMVHSKHTSPHVTTIMEADLSRIMAHRQANKDAFAKDGVNLTFTAYFVAAAVAALKAYPIVNSSWTDNGIRLHRTIHIGVAASLGEAGLIVPVIKNADRLSLLGLARLINDLAQRARSKQLKPDEVQGGTFTITNHGVTGSLFATPIINQPQCAILGVGKIQKRVVVVSDAVGNDSIAIRPMVYLGLTFDHRILDGAIADNFLGKVVETLQNWV
ncbi:MAG: dihydrolipoamide acetyltransferase family protein [Anaerolineales bacterium]|nr:dihydrolipoamide acetyltransferase family protein [Anaerolineales bacterium]